MRSARWQKMNMGRKLGLGRRRVLIASARLHEPAKPGKFFREPTKSLC
jgi:hypothetical protein